MSEESAMEVVVEEVAVAEEVDEFKAAFDLLEENISDSPKDFQDMLLNPRMDEAAVKIKEQCIYK
jgi:hypothetical protein